MSTALLVNALRLSATHQRPFAATHAAATHLHALLQQFLITSAEHKAKSTDTDAIDCFTNDLVVRKTNKWRSLKQKLTANQHASADRPTIAQPLFQQDPTSATDDDVHISLRLTAKRILADLQGNAADAASVVYCLDIRSLSARHIDQLLQSARLDDQTADFFAILDECLRWRKLPSDAVFLQSLDYLTSGCGEAAAAKCRQPEYVAQLIELCAEQNAELCAEHANFAHLVARSQWLRGDRCGALRALEEAYASMRTGRLVCMADALRAVLCEVAELAIGQHDSPDDEQVLEAVAQTAGELSRRFGENQMLQHVWRACFESEWFRHQQRARQMFEEAEEVRQFVGQQTSVIVYTWLQRHNLDAVHRLIELLLKFDMRNDCRTCLSFLFDYQYWRRDLRACSEIMRSSLDIDAPLSEAHNQKLLNLLLGTAPAQRKKPASPSAQPKFKMQF